MRVLDFRLKLGASRGPRGSGVQEMREDPATGLGSSSFLRVKWLNLGLSIVAVGQGRAACEKTEVGSGLTDEVAGGLVLLLLLFLLVLVFVLDLVLLLGGGGLCDEKKRSV